MTLIIQIVKEEFLSDFEKVAKNANATILRQDSTKGESNFEKLRKEMLDDLRKSHNRAVFERLKDK